MDYWLQIGESSYSGRGQLATYTGQWALN